MAAAGTKRGWVDVDLDGLRELLARRGPEFLLYELVQNAWDEDVKRVDIRLRWESGYATVAAEDDSPEGFRDMADAYTLYRKSYKRQNATKRGLFNAGEKFVLALCEEAAVTSTRGTVLFQKGGERATSRKRREAGTMFTALIKMTKANFELVNQAAQRLIPPVPTYINGALIPVREAAHQFGATLATVLADPEGMLRPTQRQTEVRIYEPLAGETPMLYEMGIPVVETGDRWHVDIQQKVPLNVDRDNVTPSYLRAVRVAVLNEMAQRLTKEDATSTWVKEAAGDERAAPEAVTKIIDLRFGDKRVAFDPSDVGSNREAASNDFTVVSGGSMSAGEWENARRAGAIMPAGKLFPTSLGSRVPDKLYLPDEYTGDMKWYAAMVGHVGKALIGQETKLEFIRDKGMVAGCFNHRTCVVTANLAFIRLEGRPSQSFLDLLIHELAHDTVRSNDHLSRAFYDACTRLGAELARLALDKPEWFK